MVPDIPTKFGLTRYMTDRLKEMGVNTIQFSLDTVEAALLDRLIGLSGYHKRAFAALDNLKASGIRVRVNSVIVPENIASVGHLLDYLGELGNVYRVSLTPYGRSLFRHQDELFVTGDDLLHLEEVAARKLDRFPQMVVTVSGNGAPPVEDAQERRREWEGRAFCTANRDGFVILPDGKVTVCEELYYHPAFVIGNLQRRSVTLVSGKPSAAGGR